MNGKRASDGARFAAAVLETRIAFAADSDRGHMADRAWLPLASVWRAIVAYRRRCGFRQGETEPGDFASGVGVQPLAALSAVRGSTRVWLHGCGVALSRVDPVERLSLGGAD